jgi:hypothetical protein
MLPYPAGFLSRRSDRIQAPSALRIGFACLLALSAAPLAGCAVDEDVQPVSAEFDFRFVPAQASFVSRFEDDSLEWAFTRAQGCVGEIGIHWGRTPGLAKRAHDAPGGKISPKIYAYYAVDFLAGTALQTLKVEPNHYNHVHMIFRRAEGDSIIGLDSLPGLRGHALVFEGTVARGGEVRPFRARFDSTYRENELGDILFQLRVQRDERFRLGLSPRLSAWFNDVLWSDLEANAGDTVVIARGNENGAAADKIEKRFTLDNAFVFTVEDM